MEALWHCEYHLTTEIGAMAANVGHHMHNYDQTAPAELRSEIHPISPNRWKCE